MRGNVLVILKQRPLIFHNAEVKLGTSTGKYQVEAYKVVKGVEGLDAQHPAKRPL